MIKIILDFADVKKNDVFYDLGSGDGRILKEVAKKGIQVVGIEHNSFLNFLARKKTRNMENVKIIKGNIFDQDLSKVTIIVTYLSQTVVKKLQKKIEKETKKGTRIIIVDHKFLNWEPVKIKKVWFIPIRLYVK
jgi:16S rRNA A1518/A1519 N6-dimethyltransferase RsmA/KsgA/DIM1 with predicted DNA glycosylase/AP lyase activity